MITIDAKFITFSLPGILRNGQWLSLNMQRHYGLSILNLCSEEMPIVAQCLLTENDRLLFLVFCKHFPEYAPHEALLAALSNEDLAIMRERFYDSQQSTTAYTSTMQPLRHSMSRLRNKLLLMGILIHVKSLVGYQFVSAW